MAGKLWIWYILGTKAQVAPWLLGVMAVAHSAVSAQVWGPQKVYKGPPNRDLQKKVMLCYISRPNGLQNKIF